MSRKINEEIDPDIFVKAWQTSNSAMEAGKKLGISASRASAIAAHLRSKDIPLTRFRGRTLKPHVERLKKLAHSLKGKRE